MSQYAVLIYANATADDVPTEQSIEERDVHSRYAEEVIGSGAMVAAFALEPAMAATSIRGDVMTDGPFIEAKEVVAGFYVIEAPHLHAALEIARRNPATQQGGGVEVRPVEGGFIVGKS
jgi:hypothetical protein